MDPTLSSLGPPMPNGPNEFGYCPRTPISNPVADSQHISPEACGVRRSQSSSPSRKISRFFDTLRQKSPRNENIADENRSPKSLPKRKSIGHLLQFASMRSRKALDSDDVHGSIDVTIPKTTSPSKERAVLDHTSTSQLSRRKSHGDIWGTISSKFSPRRSIMSRHPAERVEHRVDDEKPDPATSASGSLGPVTWKSPITKNKQADVEVSTHAIGLRRDSGVDVDSKQLHTPRKPSISSSMLWYEESPRTPTPVNRPDCRTPNSYLNLLIEAYYDSSNHKSSGSCLQDITEADRVEHDSPTQVSPISHPGRNSQEHSPCCGDSTQVDDEQHEEDFSTPPPPYMPDEFTEVDFGQVESSEDSELECYEISCVRDALPRVTVREVDPEDEDDSPRIHPGLKAVRWEKIKSREDSQFEHSESSLVRGTLLRAPVREGPLQNFPNIDPEFHLRGYDRSKRYQKLMTKPEPLQHSKVGISKSIELTVAKMTKNFHMVTSSEDSLESTSTMMTKRFHTATSSEDSLQSASTMRSSDDYSSFHLATSSEESMECACTLRSSDDYSFETDQMEVWDSIIIGSRTLQQAKKPFQSLKSIRSNEALRHCNYPVERILYESIELRKLHEQASSESPRKDSNLVPEVSPAFNLEKLQRTYPSSKRRREISSTMVRVEFPKTVNLGAHAEIYESKSKAIAALYEYKLSELSNFCTYDPATQTIFAHALESSVPNPAVLKQAGLEVLWLPMQKEICKLIQNREKTQHKTALSLTETNLAATQEHPIFGTSAGGSLNLDTLSTHNNGMLAANLYNAGFRGSQFESGAEFIDPNPGGPSSSLQIDPASPQREEEASIFDDDYFLEVDPDLARSFLGSQYSEASRSSSPNGNRLSPNDLIETDLAKELLWSADENEKGKPMKTWMDLGREYLAEHPPQNAWGSEEDTKPTDDDSEYSATNNLTSSRKSSWIGPSTERIEEISIFEKYQILKRMSVGRPGFSSVLVDEGNLKPPKRRHCRAWSTSSFCASKRSIVPEQDMLDLVAMSAKIPDKPKVDFIKGLKLLTEKNSLGCEISEIPFPAEEILDSFSPRSSISYTSYIEAEQAREQMYQNSQLVTPTKVDLETEDRQTMTEIYLEPKHSTEGEKSPAEWVGSEPRNLDNTGLLPESRDGQDISEKMSLGSEDSDEYTNFRRGSCISLASGFRFTEYSEQMTCESNPEKTKTESEDSSELTDCRQGSVISLGSGFKSTDYSKLLAIEEGCREGGKTSNKLTTENSAAALGLRCLEDTSDTRNPISNDDLAGHREDKTELEYRKMEDELGCDELASKKIGYSNLSPFPRDSNPVRSLSWKATLDDLNIRVVGKAARQVSPAKIQGKKVGALVNIFQAHGIIQSMKPALHRKQSPPPFPHQSGGRPVTPTARIITPSGGVYLPAGTVCVAAGRPLSSSPIKRVPTPRPPIFRPTSGLSIVDTDVSELFGERLEKAEKHSEVDHESKANE